MRLHASNQSNNDNIKFGREEKGNLQPLQAQTDTYTPLRVTGTSEPLLRSSIKTKIVALNGQNRDYFRQKEQFLIFLTNRGPNHYYLYQADITK
jgi:hypothetical protein